MKPKEFKIKIYSMNRFIISFVISFCTLAFLQKEFGLWGNNKLINVFLFLFELILSFYIANKIGQAKAKVIFTEEAFLHIWMRKFFLSFEKNIKITWNLIDNYVYDVDRAFDSFTINLKNNTRYQIKRLNFFTINDDFDKFRKNFPILANQYKNQTLIETDSEAKKIEEGESIYSTKGFKRGFYLGLVLFIILIVFILTTPNSKPNWTNLGIIGSALGFYFMQIKLSKKSKKHK